jgi:hypothetical protein
MDRKEYWRLYLVFVSAICVWTVHATEKIDFRRQIVVHLPSNNKLLDRNPGLQNEGLWWMWTKIGRILWAEGRWKEAEELELNSMAESSGVLGEENVLTLESMANLASTYYSQGHWKPAENLFIKVVDLQSQMQGAEHPDTFFCYG